MLIFEGCLFIVQLLLCIRRVEGQNLTIPETWQSPTSNLSRGSRESLAHEAALPLSTIDTSGDTGLPREPRDITSLYAVLALQDYYSGNSSWRTDVVDNMQAYIARNNFTGGDGILPLYSDVLYWGLALFYSYRNETYNNAFITPGDAASGTGLGRDVSFLPPSNCTGGTFAGGVFYMDGSDYTYVNMISLGPFLSLSAYLFEETNEARYQQAAQLSLNFILNHLWNGTLAYDGLYLSSCQIFPKPLSANQAWFIEGLSVWANVTKNDTLTTLLEDVVSSVTRVPSWTFVGGVVYDSNPDVDPNDQILKGIYIRGLAEARRRNPGTDLAQYIEAYITVQLNYILDDARTVFPNGTTSYSISWTGPAASSFVACGNVAALDVLNAAFSLVESSSTSSNSSSNGPDSPASTPAPDASTATTSHSNVGAIAGGAVGGAVVIIGVAAILAILRRRRRAKAVGAVHEDSYALDTHVVDPFISPRARNPLITSKMEREMSQLNSSTSLQTPLPVAPSASDTSSSQPIGGEQPGMAEIPSLVQRLLNEFLQGRQGELPPRYDE
ncbi:unnamed protein product [Peniophora sp. CBMAI 1063]|nr:unnamed protein product [Peniophora sp. CBMAI 1063]